MKFILFLKIIFFWQICLSLNAQNSDNQHVKEFKHLIQLGSETALKPSGWLGAYTYYAKAYQLAQNIDYTLGEAEALRYLANLEANQNQRKNEALHYFLDELKLREKIGDKFEIANSYENLGEFFQKNLHDYEQAIGYYQQAFGIHQRIGNDLAIQGKILVKIGNMYAYLEKPEKTIPFYQKALDLSLKSENFDQATQLCLEISQTYSQLKDYDQALIYAQKAPAYNHQNNHKFDKKFDDYISSLKNLKQSYQQTQTQQDNWLWLSILFLFGLGIFTFWKFKKSKIN